MRRAREVLIEQKDPNITQDRFTTVYILPVKKDTNKLSEFLRCLNSLSFSLLCTMIFAYFIVKCAFEARGYFAYGGEYIAIIMIFTVLTKLAYWFFGRAERRLRQ